MNLCSVLSSITKISELVNIFENDVHVKLGYVGDSVTINGYEGAVSTDAIVQTVGLTFYNDSKSPFKAELAELLAKKIFTPLTELVEAPENLCRLYQLSALFRSITCTRTQSPEFGTSSALKHAMILGYLDPKYRTWQEKK